VRKNAKEIRKRDRTIGDGIKYNHVRGGNRRETERAVGGH
jgi:hypothetical protein